MVIIFSWEIYFLTVTRKSHFFLLVFNRIPNSFFFVEMLDFLFEKFPYGPQDHTYTLPLFVPFWNSHFVLGIETRKEKSDKNKMHEGNEHFKIGFTVWRPNINLWYWRLENKCRFILLLNWNLAEWLSSVTQMWNLQVDRLSLSIFIKLLILSIVGIWNLRSALINRYLITFYQED